jgi:26S proteasome regulatory subunit N1
MSHPIKSYIELCVESCAYIGSGNVLKVQKMLHACSDHLEEKDAAHQAVAVIGIGLIAASEEVGNEMALRSMNHLLQYGELPIKRAIPLALALLNISNPKIPIQDLLSKLAYDNDVELSHRAIIALGLIGAGTNNARLAGILRSLASYFAKDNNTLYLLRISQGMVHMGKGLLTLQPYYSDKNLFSKVGMAGIVTFIHACLDTTNILCEKYHYLFYHLALSMYPRMLFVVDEHLEPQPLSVRVGQAVDTVGQAGQPKRITGFQTHTSPVILAYGDRAELGTEEFVPVTDCVLENIIIIKKNPDYKEPEKVRKKTSL